VANSSAISFFFEGQKRITARLMNNVNFAIKNEDIGGGKNGHLGKIVLIYQINSAARPYLDI
jgi:hypothetical protein